MTSRDFCYWLQGFFELAEPEQTGEERTRFTLSDKQVGMIRKHLNLVFVHEIDPSMGNAAHQAKLNEIHDTTKRPQGTHKDTLIRC